MRASIAHPSRDDRNGRAEPSAARFDGRADAERRSLDVFEASGPGSGLRPA
jgi:hypothetical protein